MSIYKGNNLVAGSGLSVDLIPDTVPTEGSHHYVASGGAYGALLTKEVSANKTTVINETVTDSQYPSAKAVYKALGNREPVNIQYARDLYAPDWSQAVAIPQMDLFHGYTVPKRGIFVGSTIPQTAPGDGRIKLNGVTVAFGLIRGCDIRPAYVNTPASPGDVLKSDYIMVQDGHYTIYFIPYKRQ